MQNISAFVAGENRYFDRLTPGRALAASYLFWLFVFVLAPVDPRWSNGFTGYMLIALSLMGLAVGFFMPDALHLNIAPIRFSERACKNAIFLCVTIGMLGLMFKLYDIFALRGVELDQNVIINRIVSARTESNGISVLAAMLLPFSTAALLIAWYARRMGYISRIGLWPIASGLAPVGIPFLFASRSGLLYFLVIMAVAFVNLAKHLRIRHILLFATVAIISLTLFAFVFINRVERSGQTLLYAARLSVYTQVVPLQGWALNAIDSSGDSGPVLAGYASLLQYAISGMFEFLYLVELKNEDFAWGANTFFFLPKIYDVLFNSGNVASNQLAILVLNPRSGVFQTMFGGLYLDFGMFLPLVCAVFGFAIGLIRLSVRAGNVFAFPLYALFLSQILLASMLDSLNASAAILSNLMYFLLFLVGTRFGKSAIA